MDPTAPLDLMHIPIAAPPPGVIPNFDNPVSRANQTRIAIYVMLPMMVFILLLRVYTRGFITRNMKADDYITIAAAISVIGYCGLLLKMLEYPLGIHEWDVPIGRLTIGYVKSNLASLCLSALAYMLVKTSLLALYLRIFRPSLRANVMVWSGLVGIILFYLATVLANIILYVPRNGSRGWGVMSKRTTHMILNIADTQGVVGCFTDIYILIIPVHLVMGLQLPAHRKIGVAAIFLTGLLATICAVIGVGYRFAERRKSTPDSLWESIPVYTLSIVELNVGVMCSCFPVIVILFKGLTSNSVIVSFRRYFRSRDASGESDKEAMHANRTNGLPQVPNGTLTGLKGFMQKFQKTQRTHQGEATNFTELQSRDESYHDILKANSEPTHSHGR